MEKKDDMNNLVIKAQNGDEDAKNELIKNNFPLIKSVIRRYKGNFIEYEDLYQLGCLGFAKAINNFNIDFGVKFSTYAVPMIIGEVKRYLRDDGVIKVSRSVKQKAREINIFISEYKLEHNLSPSINLLSKHFSIEASELVFIMESSKMPISLNNKVDSNGNNTELYELLSEINDSSTIMLEKLDLKDILSKLEPKDRKIIMLRYYFDKTQSEIAKQMGVSQVQISRIENKILSSLKESITKN